MELTVPDAKINTRKILFFFNAYLSTRQINQLYSIPIEEWCF